MCEKITVIDRQHREMQSPLWRRLNQNFKVVKDDMLVALATVSVESSSPIMAFKILCLC